MKAGIFKNANVPAAAICLVALVMASVILGLRALMRRELVEPGLQYFCRQGGPDGCLGNISQVDMLVRAPFEVIVTCAIVPAILAVCLLRLQKTVSQAVVGLVTVAMWVAFAIWSVVLFRLVYDVGMAPVSAPDAAASEWVLFQPLSTLSETDFFDSVDAALMLNKVAIAILLTAVLCCSVIAVLRSSGGWFRRFVAIGLVAAFVGLIWVIVARLNGQLTMIFLDRNFGTVFFDPAAPSPADTYFAFGSVIHSPAAMLIAVLLCCALILGIAGRVQVHQR